MSFARLSFNVWSCGPNWSVYYNLQHYADLRHIHPSLFIPALALCCLARVPAMRIFCVPQPFFSSSKFISVFRILAQRKVPVTSLPFSYIAMMSYLEYSFIVSSNPMKMFGSPFQDDPMSYSLKLNKKTHDVCFRLWTLLSIFRLCAHDPNCAISHKIKSRKILLLSHE